MGWHRTAPYGSSFLSYSAPGGGTRLDDDQFNAGYGEPGKPFPQCTIADVTDDCCAFDWVYSCTGPSLIEPTGAYQFLFGTSMAVPHGKSLPSRLCSIETALGCTHTAACEHILMMSVCSPLSCAVAGVAALIVGMKGKMDPAQLEVALRKSVDDLGKPGKDNVYGIGRVNALKVASL
jgi:hypothetical protein